MAYTITYKTSGEDSANLDNYSSASILVTANRLIIGAFRANQQPDTISGSSGIAWTYYGIVNNGTVYLSIYLGVATSPSNGTVTVNFSSTQNECLWMILETDIVVGSAGVIAGLQQAASANGSSITTLTATLPNNFVSANNVTLGIIATIQTGNITVGTGFTELGETNGVPGSIQAQWKNTQDLTVDWTFASSANVVAFALELGDRSTGGGFIYMST